MRTSDVHRKLVWDQRFRKFEGRAVFYSEPPIPFSAIRTIRYNISFRRRFSRSSHSFIHDYPGSGQRAGRPLWAQFSTLSSEIRINPNALRFTFLFVSARSPSRLWVASIKYLPSSERSWTPVPVKCNAFLMRLFSDEPRPPRVEMQEWAEMPSARLTLYRVNADFAFLVLT